MKKLMVFNFKMNLNYKDIRDYVENIKGKINNASFVFCPPSIFLPYFISNEYSIGLQNISEYDNGAHTGEISCQQLKSLGGTYTIIGHSERRSEQGEDDLIVNRKIKNSLKEGIKVILCIGETKEEREMLRTTRVLKREITNGLKDVSKDDLKNVIIAYEPIWSIGTGLIPTNEDIEQTIDFISTIVANLYEIKPRILYGGSVSEKNIEKLNQINNVDGFLIGGASLDYKKVLKMKEVVEK